MTRPFEGYRALWREKAIARSQACMAAGFPCVFRAADGSLVLEALQLRDEVDRTNWLTLKDACNDALLAGMGKRPIDLPLRCVSNRDYRPSYQDAANVLRRMRAWAAGCLRNMWRLKAAIEAAPTRQALMAIDLDEGWPGLDGSPPVGRAFLLQAATGTFVLEGRPCELI